MKSGAPRRARGRCRRQRARVVAEPSCRRPSWWSAPASRNASSSSTTSQSAMYGGEPDAAQLSSSGKSGTLQGLCGSSSARRGRVEDRPARQERPRERQQAGVAGGDERGGDHQARHHVVPESARRAEREHEQRACEPRQHERANERDRRDRLEPEAPKQWQGARFERARLTASAAAKRRRAESSRPRRRQGRGSRRAAFRARARARSARPRRPVPSRQARAGSGEPRRRTPRGARAFSSPASRQTPPRPMRSTKYVATLRSSPLPRSRTRSGLIFARRGRLGQGARPVIHSRRL